MINTPVAGCHDPVQQLQTGDGEPGVELGVLQLRANEHRLICCSTETIFDLITGQLHIAWEGSGCAEVISRGDPLREEASLLHAPKDAWVSIDCMSPRAEVVLIQLANSSYFAPRLRHPGEQYGFAGRRREGVLQIYPFAGDSASPGTGYTVGEATFSGAVSGSFPAQAGFYPLSQTDGTTWFGIWLNKSERRNGPPSGSAVRSHTQDKDKEKT